MQPDLLVVGYGNTLRQDDGAGPRAAEKIGELGLPGVSILICAQLSPEHVDPIAQARRVVFVDASIEASREVRLRPVTAAASSHVMTHALEPPTVLALARDVYGRQPDAWLLTIPAVHLSFGEDFSPETEQGVADAIRVFTAAFGKETNR